MGGDLCRIEEKETFGAKLRHFFFFFRAVSYIKVNGHAAAPPRAHFHLHYMTTDYCYAVKPYRRTICATTTKGSPTSICSDQSASGSFKLPSLDDILCDQAPEPYTLERLKDFMVKNHCLEVLEFVLDVATYRQWYCGWDSSVATSACRSTATLRRQWEHMMNTYIRTNSPKELNVPCNVRDDLLHAWQHTRPSGDHPVHPSYLDGAVDVAKDLMKENVYLPFIATVKTEKQRTQSVVHNHSDTALPSVIAKQKRASISGPTKSVATPTTNDTHETTTTVKPKIWKKFKWLKANNSNS